MAVDAQFAARFNDDGAREDGCGRALADCVLLLWAHGVATLSFCCEICDNVGSQKVRVLAGRQASDHLSCRAERDFKTAAFNHSGRACGPYLLSTYGDSHNPRVSQSAHLLPTYFDFCFSPSTKLQVLVVQTSGDLPAS